MTFCHTLPRPTCLYLELHKTVNMKVLSEPVMKAQEYRKIVKPLLERRRRARINQCLMELKNLLRETNPSIDNNEANRLEKADILELTVRQLKGLQLQRRVHQVDVAEFRAGFTECANEVAMCVTTLPGLDESIRNRLIAHLTGRKHGKNNSEAIAPTPPPSPREYTHLSPVPSPLDLTRAHHFESNFPRFYQQPISPPWRPW
uniref:BHLH domain-containing protein n=1 Tax=Strigamia maritima TaxID=126957 RepID=T1IVZ9_STRMM